MGSAGFEEDSQKNEMWHSLETSDKEIAKIRGCAIFGITSQFFSVVRTMNDKSYLYDDMQDIADGVPLTPSEKSKRYREKKKQKEQKEMLLAFLNGTEYNYILDLVENNSVNRV